LSVPEKATRRGGGIEEESVDGGIIEVVSVGGVESWLEEKERRKVRRRWQLW
jgi:hypothetical protein